MMTDEGEMGIGLGLGETMCLEFDPDLLRTEASLFSNASFADVSEVVKQLRAIQDQYGRETLDLATSVLRVENESHLQSSPMDPHDGLLPLQQGTDWRNGPTPVPTPPPPALPPSQPQSHLHLPTKSTSRLHFGDDIRPASPANRTVISTTRMLIEEMHQRNGMVTSPVFMRSRTPSPIQYGRYSQVCVSSLPVQANNDAKNDEDDDDDEAAAVMMSLDSVFCPSNESVLPKQVEPATVTAKHADNGDDEEVGMVVEW